MKRVLIDTQIWQYAIVRPREERYQSLHREARAFLAKTLLDKGAQIVMGSYQVAEIIEVLRRLGAAEQERVAILAAFADGQFLTRALDRQTVTRAVNDSRLSNIHVYDYLVVYPWSDGLDVIFSADSHLQHEHFKAVGAVRNPVAGWRVVEGRVPEPEG